MCVCGMSLLGAVLSLSPALIVAIPGLHTSGPAHSTVPLVQALVDGNATLAAALLDAGADPNGLDVITPLYAAQEYIMGSRQRRAVMSHLLRAGAQVDGATQDGTTALMLAAYHGDVRSARLLLSYGADPLRRNAQGYDAVQAAAQSGNGELGQMLREYVGESGLRHSSAAPLRDEL